MDRENKTPEVIKFRALACPRCRQLRPEAYARLAMNDGAALIRCWCGVLTTAEHLLPEARVAA